MNLESEIWSLRVSQIGFVRSDWNFGQVQLLVDNEDSKQPTLVFEGLASNGGFAIDDIFVYHGRCKSKYYMPCSALVKLYFLK